MAAGQLQVVLRHVRKLAGTAGSGDVTDGQLLERFVTQRDEAAFELLVRRHDLLHAMFMTQVKLVLAVLLAVTVVTGGAGFVAHQTLAAKPEPEEQREEPELA